MQGTAIKPRFREVTLHGARRVEKDAAQHAIGAGVAGAVPDFDLIAWKRFPAAGKAEAFRTLGRLGDALPFPGKAIDPIGF